MKSYSSTEIIKILRKNGWTKKGKSKGSHTFFINEDKPELGKITVPHPKKDIPRNTVESIFDQAGIKY